MVGIQQLGVLLLFGFIGAIIYIACVELIKAVWRYISDNNKRS